MSQRDKDSEGRKKSNFRVKWGYDEEDLDTAVWLFAEEVDKLPKRQEPETILGCSDCDGWFAPPGLKAYQVWGICTDDFRAHIESAHPDLPKYQWPSIVKKPLPQV